MTVKHIVTYRDSDGRIVGQHLSLAESSQTVLSPPLGYSLWDISTYSSGMLIDDRQFKIDAVSSVRAFCCPISTDYSIWNAPTYDQCAAIIMTELVLSDHTQTADAGVAGHSSTSIAEWAAYRAALRVFTSTMTGNYILDNWPVKPNDGTTAYNQYFDPIAGLVRLTTAPLIPNRTLVGEPAQFGYVGYKDHNERMIPKSAAFALYGFGAELRVEHKSLVGSYGFKGGDALFSRGVTAEPGHFIDYGLDHRSVPGIGMRGITGYLNYFGSTVSQEFSRNIAAESAYYGITGYYVSAASTQPHPIYGVAAESGQFRYTVQGYHSDLFTRGLTPTPAYLFVTPTFKST